MQITTIVEPNCVKKLEIPSGRKENSVLPLRSAYSRLNSMPLRRGIYATASTKLSIWPIIVAQAAPATPQPRPSTNHASSTTFKRQPDMFDIMA